MALLSAQHLAPSQGFFEPQRQYNWALEIALDDAGDQVVIMQSLESFEAPKVEVEEIELAYANEYRYVAGKARFDESSLVVKDFVDIGTANALQKWFQQVYNASTGSIGLAKDYKKIADLTLVSPDQSTTRIWKLIGIWPRRVEFGDLDMTGSDKVVLTASLRFDRAVAGVGLNANLSGVNTGNVNIAI